METTRNKLPEKVELFFQELSEYLDKKLLYYGSVQRRDYFEGKSDIDVDIFTDNENSTITKLQHFLDKPKERFKKIIWRLNHNNQVVYGYKIYYTSPEKDFQVEFAIYNEKYKKGVLKEHLKKTVLPFYAIWLLTILKFFYYQLHLIDKSTFTYIKKLIMTHGIGLPHDDFVVLK
uniref:Polymerase nucleotidyl transferase domain-containing protein n=1 Tax=viral metagenome TaxID=1070528 RepID=A0A6C0KY27_9ZZZZ